MKTRIYIRIAKGKQGFFVSANKKPVFTPLASSNGYGRPVYKPTVQFALDINIPDSEFDASRILLAAKIKETVAAVDIKQVTND